MVPHLTPTEKIFANHKNFGGDFDDELKKNLKKFDALEIASGYIGSSLITKYKSQLLEIAQRGYCKILIGMIFNEGVSATQKTLLEDLDADLKSVNAKSGVYVTLNQYHGKVYRFQKDGLTKVYVGSSNFSMSGLKNNYEFNVLVTEEDSLSRVNDFMDYLFSDGCDFSAKLDEVELIVKGARAEGGSKAATPSLKLSQFIIGESEFPKQEPQSSVDIVLRVDEQPNSSLNLFFDKGRKNKEGKYAPRPWYEVEITSTASERRHPDYPMGDFMAYVKDGNQHYRIPMITASDNHKAITSKDGRAILGELIKGKLERSGLLQVGQRITSETLLDYGRSAVTLKKFASQSYYLEF